MAITGASNLIMCAFPTPIIILLNIILKLYLTNNLHIQTERTFTASGQSFVGPEPEECTNKYRHETLLTKKIYT